jgi:cytoskeletal protein RodZ
MTERTTDKKSESTGETKKAGFGEHLRREREMRGISLDEICSATRIGTRFLEALENERWEQLPGGIFNRGFVRAVAHHLGLDEENLIAEYMLATGDRATNSSSVVRASAMPEPRGQWFAWVLALIVIAGLVFGGVYGWRRYAAHKRAAHPVASTELRGRTCAPVAKPRCAISSLFQRG